MRSKVTNVIDTFGVAVLDTKKHAEKVLNALGALTALQVELSCNYPKIPEGFDEFCDMDFSALSAVLHDTIASLSNCSLNLTELPLE